MTQLFLIGLTCALLGGFAFIGLVTLVVGLVKKNKKIAVTGGIAFALFALLCSIALVYGTAIGIGKVDHKLDQMAAAQAARLAKENARQQHEIAWLKSLDPADTFVPPGFHTNRGEFDLWRSPLRYPYAIHSVDGNKTGLLYREADINTGRSLFNRDITHLCVTPQHLLFRSTDVFDKEGGEVRWHIFTFATETMQSHTTKDAWRAAIAAIPELQHLPPDWTLRPLAKYHSNPSGTNPQPAP